MDHHQDEGCHTTSANIRNIAFENQKATVGSTCTLVTEVLMQDQRISTTGVDAEVGIALLGVILLDTMNMNPDSGKGTKRDEDAINFLMNNSDWSQLGNKAKNLIMVYRENDLMLPDRLKLFEFLQNSKFDRTFWLEMSARDAFRLDYKRFEPSQYGKSFGLSSALLSANDVMSKEGFYSDSIQYINEMKIDFLGILCMVVVDDKPQREIILIGKKEKIHDLSDYLVKDKSTAFLDISLTQDDTYNGDRCTEDVVVKRFHQGNPKGSRKQVAPIILSFYSK